MATTQSRPETTDRPCPWENPEWQARRRRVLRSKLHKDLAKFLEDAEALIERCDQLADAVENCPEETNPFEDAECAAFDMRGLAWSLGNSLGFLRGEL